MQSNYACELTTHTHTHTHTHALVTRAYHDSLMEAFFLYKLCIQICKLKSDTEKETITKEYVDDERH